MPCFDFVKGRPGKSMPPKKSHSWRSRNTTLPELPTHNSVVNYKDLTPEFGENRPLNMGPNSVQSDLQNNGHRYEAVSPPNNQIDDMPLDFSVKPDRNCRPQDRTASPQFGQPINVKSLDHVYITPNGERNGSTMVHFPNGMNFHFNSKTQNFKIDQTPVKIKVSPGRKGSADYFDAINLDHSQMGAKFSDTQRTKSPSPHLQSPNSSSKSPILAGMLAGSPQQLPTVEMLNSRMIPFGLPNGYPNGFNAMYVPGGIQNPNPVMANPNIYNSSIIAAPSLAYMQSQMNLLPPVAQIPLQSKADHKPVRKGKQERPFKNYDVSLQNDLQCNTLPWPVIPAINSRAIDDSNQSDALRPGSVTASSPTRADPVNGNSENSSHSDAPSAVSEMDNTPHSSMPNNALEEGAETDKNNRGRKRKPVADSEKDASYWERRKKNNQAAKRSRENRRIKEDTVAQQAVYFRGEVNNLTHALMAQRAQIQDYEMKLLSLQKDKLALTADIAVCKQALSQRRCGECGNPLGNML